MLSAGGRPHLSQAFRNVSLHSCIRACALEKEGDGETAPRGEKRRWRGAVMGEGVRVKPRKGSRQTVAAKRNPASPRASEGPGGRTSVGPRAGLCQAVLGGRGGHRGVVLRPPGTFLFHPQTDSSRSEPHICSASLPLPLASSASLQLPTQAWVSTSSQAPPWGGGETGCPGFQPHLAPGPFLSPAPVGLEGSRPSTPDPWLLGEVSGATAVRKK